MQGNIKVENTSLGNTGIFSGWFHSPVSKYDIYVNIP